MLTEAAIKGKVDPLLGLKENVIIGKADSCRYRSQALQATWRFTRPTKKPFAPAALPRKAVARGQKSCLLTLVRVDIGVF